MAKSKFNLEEKVPNRTNKWDNDQYSALKAFPLFVKLPSYKSRVEEYKKVMPMLMKLYEVMKEKEAQSVVRYIMLVYDKNSPYRGSVPLLKKRKDMVVRVLEMKDELAAKCIGLGDKLIAQAIADYMRFQDDRSWRLILQYEEVFNKNEVEILSSMSEDKDKDRFMAAKYRGQLLKDQGEIKMELEKLYTEFTGNDELAIKALRNIMYTPETIAEMKLYV